MDNIINVITSIVSAEIDVNYTLTKQQGSNTVYSININDYPKMIIKMYENEEHFNRDYFALQIMNKSTDIKSPQVIKSGNYSKKYYWIMYKYIEGCSLDKLRANQISNNLFFDIGQQLSMIHNLISFKELTQQERKLYINEFYSKFINQVSFYYKTVCSHQVNVRKSIKEAYNFLFRHKEEILCDDDFRIILNDFSPANIIIERSENTSKLSGIIDFEYFLFGNLYKDFFLLIDYFIDNRELELSFFKGYNSLLTNSITKKICHRTLIFAIHHILECYYLEIKNTGKDSKESNDRLNRILSRYDLTKGLK